ncbi:hypothetical protein [Streptomyces sp. NPDC005970]|uniref:NucA/NucB deoxyribonuclease domain-containing protein n=1 Tax=Streptomyces sp. NPDC005970 TaxID=3156723 RepID=UPI0033D12210
MWIGNACVTGSGKRAVVAYAPRTFTNKPALMAGGAFIAVVDLESGDVTKLKQQASLAYFSPGCGTGETAVLTQSGGESKNATRLITVDTKTGRPSRPIEVEGQVTSAVPVGKGIVAADSARLVNIDKWGRRTALARTDQIPFLLKPDADGGVVYMDRPTMHARKRAETGEIERITSGDIAAGNADSVKPHVLAVGPLTKMDLTSSSHGTVFITGNTTATGKLPAAVKRRTDIPTGAHATTHGEALVTKTAWADEKDSRTSPQDTTRVRPASIDLKILDTDEQVAFKVTPSETTVAQTGQGGTLSPALPAHDADSTQAKNTAASGSPTDPVEDERYCSVPRNDPRKQAMQPKPRQVEWAVDQAITNNLNKHISRPANWKNLGMGAYSPQTLFPLKALEGGGRIPAQVMLGITAQESNMWQASRTVVPGVTGNPLIGNYYGIKYAADGQQTDPWAIDWAEADCGYGITQVTDGMRMRGKEKPGEKPLTTLQQEAVALDYTANIAAGVNILAEKWNQTRKDGMTVNGGDPKYMENWFFALWAYNSGYYPKDDAGKNGGQWGVGFTNNPANPLWKANRTPFLSNASGTGDDYSHAAHPQDWPYQEKVLGWAARPLPALESPGTMVVGFRQAWWNSNDLRMSVKPSERLFCTTANSCDPSKIGPDDQNEPGLGACTRADLKCWWNQPVKWKDCTQAECGNETLRFNDTYQEEADGTAYPPNCTTDGLPGNALIIDDLPDNVPSIRPNCSRQPNSGSFSMDFKNNDVEVNYPAKIDTHQLGAGYGGHFWFAHTRQEGGDGQRLKVTGTWTLNKTINDTARVWVHLPDHGAQTKYAQYEIKGKFGWRPRTLSQSGDKNRWVSLGAYHFKDVVPQVRLATITSDGTGDQDIAFDAVAFEPGNFDILPEITVPDPDPSAPDPDYDIQEPQGSNGPTVVPLRMACSGTSERDRQICSAAAKRTRGLKDVEDPTRAKSNLNPWCDKMTHKYEIKRYEGCYRDEWPVILLDQASGGVRGTVVFSFLQEFKLRKDEIQFLDSLTFKPIKYEGDFSSIMLKEWTSSCTPAAKCGTTNTPPALPPSWNGSTTWSMGDFHQASAVRGHDSALGSSGYQLAHKVSTKIEMQVPGTEKLIDFGTWDSGPLGSIRCDSIFPKDSKGCVFEDYRPTFKTTTYRYPAAAAYYWLLREKLESHPGSKKHNSPLHKEGDDAVAKNNRNVVCKLGGQGNAWSAHPDATPDTEGVQCDEYPFATTKESGGQSLPHGKSCVQLYAKKENDGWHLYDDDREALPNWKSVCGRASMPAKQNMDAGRGPGLATFVTKMRLLDDDAYYIEVPELEGCDTSDVCVIRPRD